MKPIEDRSNAEDLSKVETTIVLKEIRETFGLMKNAQTKEEVLNLFTNISIYKFMLSRRTEKKTVSGGISREDVFLNMLNEEWEKMEMFFPASNEEKRDAEFDDQMKVLLSCLMGAAMRYSLGLSDDKEEEVAASKMTSEKKEKIIDLLNSYINRIKSDPRALQKPSAQGSLAKKIAREFKMLQNEQELLVRFKAKLATTSPYGAIILKKVRVELAG